MNKPTVENLVNELKERAKELNCIYLVEEELGNYDRPIDEVLLRISRILPGGWQYPESCCVMIEYEDLVFTSPGFVKTEWCMSAVLEFEEKIFGKIVICYTKKYSDCYEGPFLKEERKLLNTIADKISQHIFHRKLKKQFEQSAKKEIGGEERWKTVISLLKETDRTLYFVIARKMMNFLYYNRVKEAGSLLKDSDPDGFDLENFDDNKPLAKLKFREITDEVFKIAAEHLSETEILQRLEKWIQEEKSGNLLKKLENPGTTLNEISSELERYISHLPENSVLASELDKFLRVTLAGRFLSENLSFIAIAKKYISIHDFKTLLKSVIYVPNSYGKLGGKGSGLFLASNIIRDEIPEIFSKLRIPKTWYISSDGLMDFIHYNNLEEVFEQKYKEIDVIRQEYPYIVQLFKNSSFSPEMLKNLSMMLEELRDVPLIVRSSTLLEDGVGAAFSGKYKSLFIANQGSKKKRLEELTNAIAEVYASVFNADPVEYRAERGLLDYNEQMGIVVQEVVGKRVGKYYLPAFAGVAFSSNEFRWSPRIKREDGLLRIVAGLGTRAVDRVSDDYPILASPGVPGLKVNVTYEETVRYSPKKIDVINLETNSFETIGIPELLKEYGNQYPLADKVFTVFESGGIPSKSFFLDFEEKWNDAVVTFDGLIKNTDFMSDMAKILNTLRKSFGHPVDLEFAHDGEHLYLLQCRTQSSFGDSAPSPIPKDIPGDQILFTANKHISNGRIPEITHIVYVDPDSYSEISDLKTLQEVGRAVGKLNKLLPKRQFILMGPGRWGSRGDIKLGVNVTYSDINNTSVLIEIAKKKGNYVPDLSFGTHFFQDLVEASIKYIPLYPDDDNSIFNKLFLDSSKNILPQLLPEYEYLRDTVKVIDVKERTDGKILKILLNADLEEALAYFTSAKGKETADYIYSDTEDKKKDDSWKWRLVMAEKIAASIDPERFGVKNMYVFGSTKNATSGPGSDIDLLIHFEGSDEQRKELNIWLEGWGICLAELNYHKTGYKTDNLLDVHIITDEDIKNKNSYAIKINAVTDAAKKLKLKPDL